MHTAFFTNTYHPVVSGVVQSISDFRQELIQQGHNVFVFAQNAPDYKDKEPFIFRYPAVSLPVQKYPLTIPISPRIDWVLPRLKPAVIHSHHPFLVGKAGAQQAEALNIPLVFTHHTRYRTYSEYVPFKPQLVVDTITDLLADYMRQCHHIIVPSQSIKELLAQEYDITSQISVLPTGLDISHYDEIEGQTVRQEREWGQDQVLISVGRLAEVKNWGTLLKAVAQVMEQRSNVRFVLIGDGDDRKKLKQLSQDLGIADRVEFTGSMPHDDVIRHLKAADLFCFASVTETQGLVTMEGLAAGLPVVAVDASGTRDVVEDDREGLLTDNDSQALAQAIETVLADEERQERYKAAARKRAESLSIEAQVKKLLRIYERAIDDQEAGRTVSVSSPLKKKKWYEFINDLFDFESIDDLFDLDISQSKSD